MPKTLFSDLNLTPKVERAINEMGFDFATPVQSKAIPLIRTGADVIAKSQTGTGKTVAFAIPAIENVDTHEDRPTIQVLVLCPTRELAQQADAEFKKITRFKTGIHSVAIYGGAPIDRQCIQLRKANIVIGTPGRVMDHMRRKTIKLNNLKMIVLDEADEMLNMGFHEDIETILTDTPENRQTVMFSATMPPAIMKLAKEFQKDVKLIEIDKSQVTIGNIEQSYIDVPHDRKADALELLLKFYQPKRTIIFCNTKKMADELTKLLHDGGFSAACIHSDIKQSQRTLTMQSFKLGKVSILIATDIAARGIDVNDIEYVINFDIPQNTEYYVHRIGRTGRAGKSGRSVTICSSRREIIEMQDIARAVKSEIKQMPLPSSENIQSVHIKKATDKMEKLLRQEKQPIFEKIISELTEKGYTIDEIAQSALQICFGDITRDEEKAPIVQRMHNNTEKLPKKSAKTKGRPENFQTIVIDIGKARRVAPNHIMGAITERTSLSGSDIGKINVMNDRTTIDIPSNQVDSVISDMRGCKICGVSTKTSLFDEKLRSGKSAAKQTSYNNRGKKYSKNSSYNQKRRGTHKK